MLSTTGGVLHGLLKDLMPGMALQPNLLLNLYDLGIHSEIDKALRLDTAVIKTLFGDMAVTVCNEAVAGLRFLSAEKNNADGDRAAKAPLPDIVAAQIDEYLSGVRIYFDFPICLIGTHFQRTVWNALRDIPYGETRSYRQVAEAIGRPGSCRAVGTAIGRNPIWVVLPCHRVIGSDGSLRGYAGGIGMKKKLLGLEEYNNGKAT